MTPPRRASGGPLYRRQADPPPIADWRTAKVDLSEMNDPYYELPYPDDERWALRRADYVIVVAQARGWQPDHPPTLDEVLGHNHPRTHEPEPDLEAEP